MPFQLCGNASSGPLEVGIWTCPQREKRCIFVGWLMPSQPSGPGAMNRMNCLLVAMERHNRNWHCVIWNVFCIFVTTEMLIVLNTVCTVGQSLEIPTKIIQLLPIGHCTVLSQVMKGFDFWSLVIYQLLDRCFDQRHLIVATLFCSVCIQCAMLKHLHSGIHLPNLEGGLLMIQLLVRLFEIPHCSFWEF
jgi:hypothetical protein